MPAASHSIVVPSFDVGEPAKPQVPVGVIIGHGGSCANLGRRRKLRRRKTQTTRERKLAAGKSHTKHSPMSKTKAVNRFLKMQNERNKTTGQEMAFVVVLLLVQFFEFSMKAMFTSGMNNSAIPQHRTELSVVVSNGLVNLHNDGH